MKGQTMKRSHKPDGKGLPADFREIVGRLRRKEPELEHMTGNGPDRKAAGLVSRLRAKGYTAGQIGAELRHVAREGQA